ncbi:MAG: hypothetical protein CL678_03355 [Bdellovibrionaceae bacterium]|nr:hypothetical protein [Pseudobdellovibrionaceae bacterium]|tara:strand:+ start:6819 stop:8009 length:1191 start_codon:yes stop_codon:yes gene_type:complete
MIESPYFLFAFIVSLLGVLFALEQTSFGKSLFKVVPLIVFCYFVPALFSNLGMIPLQSPLYVFVKKWMLPASLLLLTLSVDIPAILSLGKTAIALFLSGTLSILIGGPIALALGFWAVPESMGEEVWKGLAALAGSWIGGGANFVAIGKSVGVQDSTIGLMVVVDVVIANLWMACLLFFAGKEKAMDKKIGADRTQIDIVRKKVQDFQNQVNRPTQMKKLMMILAIAFAGTAIAKAVAGSLPPIGDLVTEFTWVVMIVTALGVTLSFTPVRKLEGYGASHMGSVFLYILIATIGAHAEFHKVVQVPGLALVGAIWMIIHAITMLTVRRLMKAPVFLMAVASQANVGAAASAPVVASAFHPALAPVGVLLAIGGYVLGTYAAIVCAGLLKWVYFLMA